MIEYLIEEYLILKGLMVIALGWGFGYGFGVALALLVAFKERIRDYFDPPGQD